MRRIRAMVMAGVLTMFMVAGVVRPAAAAADYVEDFGLGFGAALANCLYMPVKIVYATLGGLTGGFAYVLTGGRLDTATAVWVPSMGGTYVLTPDMLRGEDRVYFSGVSQPRAASDYGNERLRDDYRGSANADRPRDVPKGGY